MLSKKDLYGNKGSYKYYIGYVCEGCALLSPLCIKFSQMNAYVTYFDENNKQIF